MRKLLLIRHGETEGNVCGRYVGRTDEPLCEKGKESVSSLVKEISFTPNFLFTSPLLRAKETAKILFPGIVPTVSQDLREMDFGIFEYKTAFELEENTAYAEWVKGGCLARVPGGDDVKEFKARCVRGVKRALLSLPQGKSAAFVTHGGVIMAALEALSDEKRPFYDYHLKNAQGYLCYENDLVIKIAEKIGNKEK